MLRLEITFVVGLVTLLAACTGEEPRRTASADPTPIVPKQPVDASGGTGKRGPGTLFNACERIWCLTHERNYDLDHFATGHIGWILHEEGSGDIFVPKHRTGGPEFPDARLNVLALCGRHLHPYWLGSRSGPVRKLGYNVALGYDRGHFRAYGTRLTPCCVNAEAWGFLHSAAPREYRFGDRTAAAEAAGSGWQKALPARSSGASAPASGAR
jgi:hypothetical protein